MRRERRRVGKLLGAPALAAALLGCGGARDPVAPPPDAFDLTASARIDAMSIKPRLARPPTPPPSFDDPQRLARLRRALPTIEGMLDTHVTDEAIPALAAGVILDGELVLAKGWGQTRSNGAPVGPDTIFRIGSVTKVVTAMALLALVADGKVSLDDPAARHLPELEGLLYPSLDAGVITVRHLLTHTSGLPRPRTLPGVSAHPDEDEILAALDGLALEQAPGQATRYSDLGGGLLGLLVSRASGVPLRDYVRRRVLGRLGIDDMAWDAGDVPLERLAAARDAAGLEIPTAAHERIGPLEGSEGLYGSVAALAKLVAHHLDAWPPRSDPSDGPLPRGLLRESHRMQAFQSLHVLGGSTPRGRADGTGLIWQVRQSCAFEHLVWHNGNLDGHRAAVFLLPQRGLGVILLAAAPHDLSPLASDILTTLVRDAALPTRKMRPSPALTDALAEVVRMYQLGNLNEPDYQRLFDPSYRERTSLQALRRTLAKSRSRRGPCELERVLTRGGPHRATVHLRCERATARLDLALSAQPPHQVRDLVDLATTADELDDADSTSPCR